MSRVCAQNEEAVDKDYKIIVRFDPEEREILTRYAKATKRNLNAAIAYAAIQHMRRALEVPNEDHSGDRDAADPTDAS